MPRRRRALNSAKTQRFVPIGIGLGVFVAFVVFAPASANAEPTNTAGTWVGIELNAKRAEATRAHLGHVLETSAFSVRLAYGAFSYIFLNPPYHHDDEKQRQHDKLTTTFTRHYREADRSLTGENMW